MFRKKSPENKNSSGNGVLNESDMRRYSRHIMLQEVGKAGQEKIKKAKVLIIGAGGLGSPAALYLAAAGIGTLGIADFDNVEESNLQRQILHSANDIGKSKLDSAKEKISALNPSVGVKIHNNKIDSKNIIENIKNYDIIIDGTDNLPAKYLINDACILLGKPWIYGSVFRFEGRASVFNCSNGPCYRCLSPEIPPRESIQSCAEAGVLGVLPGVMGTIQATEALKMVLEIGETLSGRLLVYDALAVKFTELKINRNNDCPVCGDSRTTIKLEDYDQQCNGKNWNNEVGSDEISVHHLKEMLDRKEDFLLVDVRERQESEICRIEGAKLAPLSDMLYGNLEFFNNLDKNRLIALHCKSGTRSLHAMELLKTKGFTNLKNVSGGIDEWAEKIDNNMPKY
ncbi:molybdopterin-synthase adenylyltransferase MoeB [Candidatus Woesearchaeota archaeon]|nr:molybdopterin-synthase adenylyltransferase MoeB [Candidatus Woesearchaeota archaeon]